MLLNDVSNIGEPLSLFFFIFGWALFTTSVLWNFNGFVADAQDTPSALSSSQSSTPPTILIISHQDGERVPIGELTIEGISSDNENADCQVYADVNDNTPMRNVTATGVSGDLKDFSKWAFTYTRQYQLINEGENEITAKISCFSNHSDTPMSEWHTVNVTGVSTMAGRTLVVPPSFSSTIP